MGGRFISTKSLPNCFKVTAGPLQRSRCWWYVEQLHRYEMEVVTASNGLECVERLRTSPPEIILLEPSLLWGGSHGVLAVRSEDAELQNIPVVLIAVDGVSPEWYQLAQYSVQGLLLRRQSGQKLAATLHAAVEQPCGTSLVR